jgi:hypothetical protein
MNFNLNFCVSQTDDCKSIKFCDTTCQVNHFNSFTCCDGYGVGSNITRENISYTRFDFKFPDATTYLDLDLSWTPGTRAKSIFQVTAGTSGVIVLDINGLILGQQIFITDLPTTINALIQNVNSISASTGWQAYLQDGSTDIIIVESINMGTQYNGKFVNVSFSGDIAVTMIQDPTSGANGNDDCRCITLDEIYNIADCVSTEFPDGVYEITYVLYNSLDEEIGRVTKHVLLTCLLKTAINKLILLPAESKCSCSDGFQDKLVELRLMLEKAELQMVDCLYDCANDTIKSAHKMANGICLDC